MSGRALLEGGKWLAVIAALDLCGADTLDAQRGRIVTETLRFPALEGNLLGEPAERDVVVYLPPSYDGEPERRYPTVYLFHGFTQQPADWLDGEGQMGWMDSLIATGLVGEMIVVMPSMYTRYRGSLPVNGSAFGDGEDYITRDLVGHADETYRTLPSADKRGLIGLSMGGFAVTYLGMRNPDVFCALFAMDAGPLDYETDFLKMPVQVRRATDLWEAQDWQALARHDWLTQIASSLSPNQGRPPLFFDWPWRTSGETMAWIPEVESRWRRAEPVSLVGPLRGNLRQLRAIGFDAGTHEDTQIEPTSILSRALDDAGVAHRLFVYPDRHTGIPGIRRGVAFSVVWQALSGQVPPVASASVEPPQVWTGRTHRLQAQIRLRLPVGAVPPEVTLDLSPLGLPPARLEPEPDGAYRFEGEVVPRRNGRLRLPIFVGPEGRDPFHVAEVPLLSLPTQEQPVFTDGTMPGWRLEPERGELDPAATEEVFTGEHSLRIAAAGATVFRWVATEPVDGFGHVLRLAFHPGTIDAARLPLLILHAETSPGNERGQLDLLTMPGAPDVARKIWQIVEIPWERIEPYEPIRAISFSGALRGTFFLDDVSLIPRAQPSGTAVAEPFSAPPADFALLPAYPNPFNAETVIGFRLPAPVDASLTVHNILGQRVATVVEGPRSAGAHSVRWDGQDEARRDMATGVYFVRLEAGTRVVTRRVLLLR